MLRSSLLMWVCSMVEIYVARLIKARKIDYWCMGLFLTILFRIMLFWDRKSLAASPALSGGEGTTRLVLTKSYPVNSITFCALLLKNLKKWQVRIVLEMHLSRLLFNDDKLSDSCHFHLAFILIDLWSTLHVLLLSLWYQVIRFLYKAAE